MPNFASLTKLVLSFLFVAKMLIRLVVRLKQTSQPIVSFNGPLVHSAKIKHKEPLIC